MQLITIEDSDEEIISSFNLANTLIKGKVYLNLESMEINKAYIIDKLRQGVIKHEKKWLAETKTFIIIIPDRYCRYLKAKHLKKINKGQWFFIINRGRENGKPWYQLEMVVTPQSQKHLAMQQ